MFDNHTQNTIIEMAIRSDIEPAALLAVVEVESGGRALFDVNGQKEPAIRFEGHYFDRRLSGSLRERARKEGLGSPHAGRIPNPRSQSGRWLLLNRAMKLNRVAALESTSWGLGQVMGAHWEWLGFESIDALTAQARNSIGGQVVLMLRFIQKAGLISELQAKDWRNFARRYNGPAFARNQYDVRMAVAYDRWVQNLSQLRVA